MVTKKPLAAMFLTLAALLVPPAFAVCKSEACKRAVAWKQGYTAVVLDDDISREDYFRVLETIKQNKGVVAIEAERVLLGWVPKPASSRIERSPGVRAVLSSAAPRPGDLVQRGNALAALDFFNRVVTGEYEDRIEEGLAIHGEPLTGCVPNRSSATLQVQSLGVERDRPTRDVTIPGSRGNRRDVAERGKPPEIVEPMFWYRTPYQNPDMRGRVTVQVFRLDSDGSDPNEGNWYTWTSEDYATARDQIYGAFMFWANEAAARGITLSFSVFIMDPFSRYCRCYIPTPTRYEPIRHSIFDDYLWVNDALTRYGYGASPVTQENVYTRNEDFNRDRLSNPNYGQFDRSFSVYVAYNPPPASDRFADGFPAWAWYDGPLATVLWNTAGWGGQNLGRVIAHETGHIFWACDEYREGDRGCGTCLLCHLGGEGPRNQVATPWITNRNCEYSGAQNCDNPRVDCMMRWDSFALCPHTPAQVGW